MAEAAGLAIGATGLAGPFTSCVKCLDYISPRRNHRRDFETSLTKLMLLRARLAAWGKSLRVTRKGKEKTALRTRWTEQQSTVGIYLMGIKTILIIARSLNQSKD